MINVYFPIQFCIFYVCIVSALSFPAKKVVFPNDDDDIDEQFSYANFMVNSMDSVTNNKHFENTSKLQFRIDANIVPCINATIPFCEDVNQRLYPSQYVESMLQKSPERFTEFFNKIEMRADFTTPTSLCETYRRQVHPQMAMNVQDDWHFVINVPNYRQLITVEKCRNGNSKCKFSKTFPIGTVALCTQKYMEVPLLSLDYNGNFIEFNYNLHRIVNVM